MEETEQRQNPGVLFALSQIQAWVSEREVELDVANSWCLVKRRDIQFCHP